MIVKEDFLMWYCKIVGFCEALFFRVFFFKKIHFIRINKNTAKKFYTDLYTWKIENVGDLRHCESENKKIYVLLEICTTGIIMVLWYLVILMDFLS